MLPTSYDSRYTIMTELISHIEQAKRNNLWQFRERENIEKMIKVLLTPLDTINSDVISLQSALKRLEGEGTDLGCIITPDPDPTAPNSPSNPISDSCRISPGLEAVEAASFLNSYYTTAKEISVGDKVSTAMWFKTNQDSATATATASYPKMDLTIVGGKLQFELSFSATDSIITTGTTTVTDDVLHHVTFTLDRIKATVEMKLDGATEALNTVHVGDIKETWTVNLSIAATDSSEYQFEGEVFALGYSFSNDLILIDTDLYNNGIPSDFDHLPSATVSQFDSYWELSRENLTDRVACNSLTAQGTVVKEFMDMIISYISCTSGPQQVNTPVASFAASHYDTTCSRALGKVVSTAMWFKTNQDSATATASYPKMDLTIVGGKLQFELSFSANDSLIATGNTTVTDDVLHHVTATLYRNTNSAIIMLDGVAETLTTVSLGAVNHAGTGTISIAATELLEYQFTGELFALGYSFNNDLTAIDAILYNNGIPTDYDYIYAVSRSNASRFDSYWEMTDGSLVDRRKLNPVLDGQGTILTESISLLTQVTAQAALSSTASASHSQAEGTTIDVFGKVLGRGREAGQLDTEYRQLIYSRILENTNHGTLNEFLIIMAEKIQRDVTCRSVYATESFPASVIATVAGESNVVALGEGEGIDNLLPAGVGSFVNVFETTSVPFGFAGSKGRGLSAIANKDKGGFVARYLTGPNRGITPFALDDNKRAGKGFDTLNGSTHGQFTTSPASVLVDNCN